MFGIVYFIGVFIKKLLSVCSLQMLKALFIRRCFSEKQHFKQTIIAGKIILKEIQEKNARQIYQPIFNAQKIEMVVHSSSVHT